MSEVKPATDEEIASISTRYTCPDCGCQNADKCETFMPKLIARILIARIESDRAEIDRLKAEVERLTCPNCLYNRKHGFATLDCQLCEDRRTR